MLIANYDTLFRVFLPRITNSIDMKLKEIPNTVVNVKTQEEYDELMRIYEKAGWTDFSEERPTLINIWRRYKENTCIEINNRFSSFNSRTLIGSCFRIISLAEFKKIQGIRGGRPKKEPASRLKVETSQVGRITKTLTRGEKIFTGSEINQMLSYIEERNREGWYYGNKKQFEQRQEKIVNKLKRLKEL